MRYFFNSFDGARIAYHKTVRDPSKWIVFVHGLGGDLTAWEKERRFFDSLGVSTIAMDLRGHGLSERGLKKDFYSLDNHIKDIKSLIDHEGIINPVLVGHCLGGMISIYFSATYPDLLRSLVLIDTSYKLPFFSDHRVSAEFLELILSSLATVLPDKHIQYHTKFKEFYNTEDFDFKRILSDILHASLKSYLFVCSNVVEYDATELLKKIIQPTLVIDGGNDSIFPPLVAENLRNRLINSEIKIIPGANHILVINSPNELESVIKSYLEQIEFM